MPDNVSRAEIAATPKPKLNLARVFNKIAARVPQITVGTGSGGAVLKCPDTHVLDRLGHAFEFLPTPQTVLPALQFKIDPADAGFTVRCDNRAVAKDLSPDALPEVILAYRLKVRPGPQNVDWVRGRALARGGRAVAIFGGTPEQQSSIADELGHRGWRAIARTFVPVDFEKQMIGADDGGSDPAGVRLAAVVFCMATPVGPQLSPAQAAIQLVSHVVDADRDLNAAAQRLAAAMAATPALVLDPANVAATCDRVEGAGA